MAIINRRKTAPCIALSALVIKRYYKGSNMLVLPSDHIILQEYEFKKSVYKAGEFIKKNKNAIITFGMKSIRPETE